MFCVIAVPAEAQTKAKTPAADPVIATLPHKSLRASDLMATWFKLGPGDRPKGEGLALRKAVLEELLNKEALGRAAIAEPFVMTEAESARFLAFQNEALQQALYKKWVLDSLVVTDADRAQARASLASAKADTTDPGTIEANARPAAERRRGDLVAGRIKATLNPAWDDSALAFTARAFASLPPSSGSLDNPMAPKLPQDIPTFAPADTGRVIVRATGETMTIAGFVRAYQVLNPFQRKPPVTAGEVQGRAEQFIGAAYFLREAKAQGLAQSPDVKAALANRRESIALDHYYTRHVADRVDTSATALQAQYAKDPSRYAVPAHLVLQGMPVRTQAAADSVVKVLASGTPWDSLCAGLFPTIPPVERPCTTARNIPVEGPDSALVHAFDGPAPHKPYIMPLPTSSGGTGFIVWRHMQSVAKRIRPFDEARSFVLRDAGNEQSEALLMALIKDLRTKMPVKIDEPALARVELPSVDGPRP